jgi:hypothetical protein
MAEMKEILKIAPEVLRGTGHDVARLLQQMPERITVAVTFPDDEQGRADERVIRQLMEFLPELIRKRQQETLKKLIDAFLSDATPRRRLANRPVRASRPKQRH